MTTHLPEITFPRDPNYKPGTAPALSPAEQRRVDESGITPARTSYAQCGRCNDLIPTTDPAALAAHNAQCEPLRSS